MADTPKDIHYGIPEGTRATLIGFSEDGLVEKPAVELLESLGWNHFNLYEESFGLDGSPFRDTLRDQSAQFVTRDEYQTGHAAVVRNAEVMRIDLSTSAVRIEQTDRAAAVERAQLDKRLDALNDFRVQLKDQAETQISRSEVTVLIASLQTDVRRLEIAGGEKAGRDDSVAAFDRIDLRLKVVEGKLATWDGRLWALGSIFLMINIFVSWWLSGIRLH